MFESLVIKGNEILEQLHLLGCKTACLVENESEEYVCELQVITTRVRDSWTFVVCSGASETVLNRYFDYQITRLNESVDMNGKHSCLYKKAVGELIDWACAYFKNFVPDSIALSATYKSHFVLNLSANACLLLDVLKDAGPEAPLQKVLARYLEDMTGDTPCTIGQLRYFSLFVREMLPLTTLHGKGEIKDFLHQKLLDLEFNHFGIFVNLQESNRLSFSGKPRGRQKTIIRRQLDLLNFTSRGEVLRYDDRWPPLSAMLADWLRGELLEIDRTAQKQVSAIAGFFKLPLRLPVSHLAFLVRLLYKADIFGSVQLNAIFNFFTGHFSTKRQQDLSLGAFSKEYYTKNLVTAVEVRDLLSKMIRQINQDYFPVMAAISITIFCW